MCRYNWEGRWWNWCPCVLLHLDHFFWALGPWYGTSPTVHSAHWVNASLVGISKCPISLSPPPGKKAPGLSPVVSQCSFPTANLPGGKAGLFGPGDDDPHSSFTELTATLATSKDPMSNLRLNFHETEPFISLIPLPSWRSPTVQVEQQRLPHSISASYSLHLCQGKCQQEPCPDRGITGSVLLCCCHHETGPQLCAFYSPAGLRVQLVIAALMAMYGLVG